MSLTELLAVIDRASNRRWTVLRLVNKQIVSLPLEIYQLVKLRLLYLSHNNLRNLPPEIKRLHHLKELDIDHNELREIPPEIGELSNLEKLNVSFNKLESVPEEMGALADLLELDLSFNQIHNLPSQIGALAQLKKLKLNNNRLKALPSSLGRLGELRSLYLSNTPLSSLPIEIGQLSKLIVLSVRNAELSVLPNTIADLRKLRQLEVEGNPLTSPPPEVVQQGTETILAFLRNLQTAGTERFEAKVLLLGQGGVGKTSILRSLRGLEFVPDETTTRGVDVDRLELPHPKRQDVTLKLNVWDFAGQEIEHATHQFFMSNKSVYVLVWNSRHGYVQGRLDYWLEMIKSRAPEAPVILVATHADQRWPDINFAAFQQTYPQLVAQYYVDNYSGTGIEDLRLAIAQWGAQLPLMGQPWPGNWQAVEDQLKELRQHHISFAEFEAVCADLGLANESDVSALSETLHNLGIILHFEDDVELRELVVLKPNWITKAISFALTDSQTGRSYGRLDHASLPRIWSQYDPLLYPAFFALMNKFELCYQIEDADDLSLIPALLSYAPPSIPDLRPKLRMIYRLSSVPPGIMSRFIVRSHRFTRNTHWREGVVLGYDGQFAKAELFEHPREIHLTVDGSSPTYFFAVLIDTLDQILQSYPGLGVERKIPCICKGDGTFGERCSYIFSYEDVVLRKEKGKDLIECNLTLEQVSLNELLYGIHELSTPQIREQVSTVTSAPEEHYRQVILLGQRGVIHNYNRLESIDSRCPNVFVPFRVDSRRLLIQLICQSGDGWHYASSSAKYEFPDNEDVRRMLAPLFYETLPLISHIVPLSGMDISLRTKVPRRQARKLRSGIELMREVVNTSAIEQGGLAAIRDALRDFYLDLDAADEQHTYGGLRNITTPDGLRRWLCPFHYAHFQQATLRPSETRFDAFLCHNAKDMADVRDIGSYLQKAGVNYWLDEERLLGGDRWQDGLARGLRESASTVVFIGRHGWGDWQLEELQVALNLAAGKRSHRVIPLLLPPLREVPADFPPFLRTRHAVTLSSIADASGLRKLITSIRQTDVV